MPTITHPTDYTLVDVWSDRLGRFYSVRAGVVRCHTCGNKAAGQLHWDNGILVCRCGELFLTSEDQGE